MCSSWFISRIVVILLWNTFPCKKLNDWVAVTSELPHIRPSVSLMRIVQGDWNRAVSWNNPCRCLDGHVKEPYEMSMTCEPDHRSSVFFSPPAHLCAVTCITEISLNVTNLLHSNAETTMDIHGHLDTRFPGRSRRLLKYPPQLSEYTQILELSWIGCLTSQLTIFQSYMWRHIDVQADWRRSWTYGRAPNAIDIS